MAQVVCIHPYFCWVYFVRIIASSGMTLPILQTTSAYKPDWSLIPASWGSYNRRLCADCCRVKAPSKVGMKYSILASRKAIELQWVSTKLHEKHCYSLDGELLLIM